MKPDCLLSKNIDDHNFLNRLPTILPDGFRHANADSTCLDCFATCHMVFYGKEYDKPTNISWVTHQGIFTEEDSEKLAKFIDTNRDRVRSFIPVSR